MPDNPNTVMHKDDVALLQSRNRNDLVLTKTNAQTHNQNVALSDEERELALRQARAQPRFTYISKQPLQLDPVDPEDCDPGEPGSRLMTDGCNPDYGSRPRECQPVAESGPAWARLNVASVNCCAMDSSSCVTHDCWNWATYNDAEGMCADLGMRVCTVREVEAGACCSSRSEPGQCADNDNNQVWVDVDPVPYAYLGGVGDTDCPSGTVDRENCWFAGQTLMPADAISVTSRLYVGSWSDRPSGCAYRPANNNLIFNNHADGRNPDGYRPVCLSAER